MRRQSSCAAALVPLLCRRSCAAALVPCPPLSVLVAAGSTNGDGSFTYPGEGGKPLGSLRLSNIADGIEDWELFNKLGATGASLSRAADLITRLVRNRTDFELDVRALERARREAAHRIVAQAASRRL